MSRMPGMSAPVMAEHPAPSPTDGERIAILEKQMLELTTKLTNLEHRFVHLHDSVQTERLNRR
jgi:hypothetical protein